jgi:hypothetical protein
MVAIESQKSRGWKEETNRRIEAAVAPMAAALFSKRLLPAPFKIVNATSLFQGG